MSENEDDELEMLLAQKAALDAKIQKAREQQSADESPPAPKPRKWSQGKDPSSTEKKKTTKKKPTAQESSVPEDKPAPQPEPAKKYSNIDRICDVCEILRQAQKDRCIVCDGLKNTHDHLDAPPHEFAAASKNCPTCNVLRDIIAQNPKDYQPKGTESASAGKPDEKPKNKWAGMALGVAKAVGKGTMSAFDGIGKVIDDMEAGAKANEDLSKHNVTWLTAASPRQIFEALAFNFRTKPIGMTHRWSRIEPISEYMLFNLHAQWQETADNWTFVTAISGTLTITEHGNGAAVNCVFHQHSNNLMNMDIHADHLIKNTNLLIREVCRQTT